MDEHNNCNGDDNNGQNRDGDNNCLLDDKWEDFENEVQKYCGGREQWMDQRDNRKEAVDHRKLLKSTETWDFPLSVMNKAFSFKNMPIQDLDFIKQLNDGNTFEICAHNLQEVQCSGGCVSCVAKCSKCQVILCFRCTPEGNPATLNNQQEQDIGNFPIPNQVTNIVGRPLGPQNIIPFGFLPRPFPPSRFPPPQHGFPYNSQMPPPGIHFIRFPPPPPGMYLPGSCSVGNPTYPLGISKPPGFIPNQSPVPTRSMFQTQQQQIIVAPIDSDPTAKNGMSTKQATKNTKENHSNDTQINGNISRATRGLFIAQTNYGQSPPLFENADVILNDPVDDIENNCIGNPSNQNKGQPKTKTAAELLKELVTGATSKGHNEDLSWRNPVPVKPTSSVSLTDENTRNNKTNEKNESVKRNYDVKVFVPKNATSLVAIADLVTSQDRNKNENSNANVLNEQPNIGFGNPSNQNKGQPKPKTAAALLKEQITGVTSNGDDHDEDLCWRSPGSPKSTLSPSMTEKYAGNNTKATETNESAKENGKDLSVSKNTTNLLEIADLCNTRDRNGKKNTEISQGKTEFEKNLQYSEDSDEHRRNSLQNNCSYYELLTQLDFLTLDDENEHKKANTTVENNDLSLVELAISCNSQSTPPENESILPIPESCETFSSEKLIDVDIPVPLVEEDTHSSPFLPEDNVSSAEIGSLNDGQLDAKDSLWSFHKDTTENENMGTKNMITEDNKADTVSVDPETKRCGDPTSKVNLLSLDLTLLDLSTEEIDERLISQSYGDKDVIMEENIIPSATADLLVTISDPNEPNVHDENTIKQIESTTLPTIPSAKLKFGIGNRKNLVKTMMQEQQELAPPECQNMPTLKDLQPAQSIEELMKNKEAVFVTHFSAFKTAYIISSAAFHNDLLMIKEDIFEVMEQDGGAKTFYQPPPIGTVVLAPLDKQYNRAVVEDISSEAISVRFIDIGSTARVRLSKLVQVTKEIMSVPILGRQIFLKDAIDSKTDMILLSDFENFVRKWPLQRECYIKSGENLDGFDVVSLEYRVNGISKLVSNDVINLGKWKWEDKWQKMPGIAEGSLCNESNWKVNCFEAQIRKLKEGQRTKGTVVSATPAEAEVAFILNIANEYYYRDRQVLNKQIEHYVNVVKGDETYFPALGEYVLVKIMPNDKEEFKNLRGLGKWNRCIREGSIYINLDECECYPVSIDYRDIFKVRKYCPDFAKVPFFMVNCRIKECWPLTAENEKIFKDIAKPGSILTFCAIDSKAFNVSCQEYYYRLDGN